MWLGACVSTIGTLVQQFAQSWLVYDLTKNAFYLGLDLFLGQLPIMLFSLVGGVFADRLTRQEEDAARFTVCSDGLRFCLGSIVRHACCACLAYPDTVFHRRGRAVLRRTGLFGTVADAGGA
jgi:hypothetical protein